jgi:hypothetical protein
MENGKKVARNNENKGVTRTIFFDFFFARERGN